MVDLILRIFKGFKNVLKLTELRKNLLLTLHVATPLSPPSTKSWSRHCTRLISTAYVQPVQVKLSRKCCRLTFQQLIARSRMIMHFGAKSYNSFIRHRLDRWMNVYQIIAITHKHHGPYVVANETM